MTGQDAKKPDRVLLLLELIAFAVSFVLSIYIRYGELSSEIWMMWLYLTLFAVEAMMQIILYLYHRSHHKASVTLTMDPVDTAVYVVKHQIVLFIFLMLVLFATRSTILLSRLVLGMMFIFNIILQFIVRLLFGRYMRRHKESAALARRYLVIVGEGDRERVLQRLTATLPEGSGIEEVLVIPENGARDMEKDKLTVAAGKGVRDVFAYLNGVSGCTRRELIKLCYDHGMTVHESMLMSGEDVTPGQISRTGGFVTRTYAALTERCDVMGIGFNVTNTDEAVSCIRQHIDELRGRYICFSNVHTTVTALDDPAYRSVLNSSAFTFADGRPVADAMKRAGYANAVRVAGPDFMEAMFIATQDGSIAHFFYGASEDTIIRLRENLTARFPGIRISGMYSPPFRPLTGEEDAADVKMINDSGADIVWVGLGAPKQEKWMSAHSERIHALMAGVGAGFDFHAGTVNRAPFWIRKIGLEWLYRLFQDPKRLWKRYVVTNTRFILYRLTER